MLCSKLFGPLSFVAKRTSCYLHTLRRCFALPAARNAAGVSEASASVCEIVRILRNFREIWGRRRERKKRNFPDFKRKSRPRCIRVARLHLWLGSWLKQQQQRDARAHALFGVRAETQIGPQILRNFPRVFFLPYGVACRRFSQTLLDVGGSGLAAVGEGSNISTEK